MALANLKLSSPGHFLTEGLEDCLTSIPSDLVIQCCDGKVFLHKVILAPRLVSQAFVKVLKAHFEDDLVHILIPDAFKSQVEHLVQLLYCGKTFTSVSEEDLEGLKTLAQLLKIGSLELTTMLKDADTEHAEVPELSIAYFDKKKTAKKTLPFEDLEESLSLRRSKRPKIRNKRLDDDAFAKEDFSGKVELTRPDQVGSSTEKTIASVKVEVTEPKEEALELQAPKSMLPAEVVRHCLICEKKLVGKFAFSKHLKSKHSQGWYKCKSCDAPFLSGFKLHEHARLKRHQDLEPKKYQKTTFQCGLCESTFATFNAFQSHSLSNHNIFPLECQICKKRYKEQATFKNHMETHQGVLKYECDVCAKRFVTRERLFAHRRLHLGKRFKCSQCEFKARSSTALRTHIQMKHLEPKYECVLCMKKFGSKQNLEQHEVVHTGLTPWHCNICDVRFKRQHHFKAHLNSNNHKTKNNEAVVEKSKKAPAIVDIIPEPEPQIECQVCRTSFKFDFHLKQHLRSKNHTSKVEEKLNRGEAVPDHLIVDKSDYVFDFANDDFLQHADQNELFLDDSNVQLIVINEANQDVMLMTHDAEEVIEASDENETVVKEISADKPASDLDWRANFSESAYKSCYLCAQKFLGLHQLTKHLRMMHDKSANCIECSRQVPNGLSLHEHLRSHFKGFIHPDGQEVNICEGCGLSFRTKSSLLKHFSLHHSLSKQNTYRCQECTYTCFTAKHFSDHMLNLHNRNPFQCEDCGAGYKHKANLDDHIKAKHGSVDIPCDKCGKTFKTKTSLFVHRREQHELGDSRKVKCDVCSFEAKGIRNLKKHKETHSKAAYSKYQCLYCNKTFRNRNSLNVHERVHTGETPYRCNLCAKHFKRSHHLYSHLKCQDHVTKSAQFETEGKPIPDPVYSITKGVQFNANPPPNAGDFGQPIYMEVTEVDGSVQVVIPGDASMANADQLFLMPNELLS